jgi:hypothetical protein
LVAVRVGVDEALGLAVLVAAGVGVVVGDALRVGLRVGVAVRVAVPVRVGVRVGAGVAVAFAKLVGAAPERSVPTGVDVAVTIEGAPIFGAAVLVMRASRVLKTNNTVARATIAVSANAVTPRRLGTVGVSSPLAADGSTRAASSTGSVV